MSKARAKGTAGENYFLPRLRNLFGDQVERAPLKGIQDKGDYTGVPWLHEAKNTATPLFLEWAAKADSKVPGFGWAVLWKGDLRRSRRNGPYVLMPYELYGLLVEYATWDEATGPEVGLPGRLRMITDDIQFLGGR